MKIINMEDSKTLNVMTTKENIYSRGVLKYDVTRDLFILRLKKKDGDVEEKEFDYKEGNIVDSIREIIENN